MCSESTEARHTKRLRHFLSDQHYRPFVPNDSSPCMTTRAKGAICAYLLIKKFLDVRKNLADLDAVQVVVQAQCDVVSNRRCQMT